MSLSDSNAPKLILASGSPRRLDLLQNLGVKFEVVKSDLDESTDKTDPIDIVKFLSLAKAREVASKLSADPKFKKSERTLVLGADTIVVLDQDVLGKPESRKAAFDMLMRLSGKEHKVYTGVSLVEIPGGACKSIYQVSSVSFRVIQPSEAHYYANTDEPMDKAGSYALQGIAAAFVERINGCYTNIIGLPIPDTVRLLRQHGMHVMGAGTSDFMKQGL